MLVIPVTAALTRPPRPATQTRLDIATIATAAAMATNRNAAFLPRAGLTAAGFGFSCV
jgi:hypothetical protein